MSLTWREPILHFLLLGAAIFFVYGYFRVDDVDDRTIVVSRDRILSYLQTRSRALGGTRTKDFLDRLTAPDLQQLFEDFVREEALYREAKSLGLDRNDYVVRRRLVQQLEFIASGFGDAEVDAADTRVAEYYEAHRSNFYVAPRVTFTHVFFSSERHGAAKARVLAREALQSLNRHRVRFDQAPQHGDRFLYHVNYVSRGPEEVASDFGADMQSKLFSLKPTEQSWQGPFESPHGFHVVMLVGNEAGGIPPLEAIRPTVAREAQEHWAEEQKEQALQSIIQGYRINVRRDEFRGLRGARG